MSRSLLLSWRFLLRDWRSGELWLLMLSLLMAVSVSTSIAIFSDRLQLSLGRQVAEVMGADLVISSSKKLSEEVSQAIEDQPVEQATVLEFPSVVMAGDQMQLVSAKAVTLNYPLRGHMRTADQPFVADEVTEDTPAEGEVWLEPRLFPLLEVEVGDTLLLGEAEFKVARAITLETDRGSGFYSLSPRLMFNISDLGATGIIQPGSRVHWRTLIAGEAEQLATFKSKVEPLLSDSEKLNLAEDDREDLRGSVVLLKQFLGLGSIAAMLLAGIAVAMSSRRFAERRFDGIAVMRCMGAQQNQLMQIFVGELLWMAVLVSIPGVIIGWLLQVGVVKLLANVLPPWLPEAGPLPMIVGGLTGIITLVGFGLAPLLRLKDVTPLRVLRRELTPAAAGVWSVYGLSLIAMLVLLWYHTGQLLMTVGMILGVSAVILLITLTIKAGLASVQRRLSGQPVPMPWRLGLKRLLQEQGQTSAQLTAFTLTFMAMALVLLVRTDLLERWQQQLPEKTPNYFAINIQPAEVKSFQNFLQSNDINGTTLYPMVRGRLIEINGLPAKEAVTEEQRNHNSLHRELNMTWSDRPRSEVKIVAGEWWQPGDTGEISIERSIVEHLGVDLGDELTFTIAGTKVTAEVTSIREVQWESFQPNFYMILPEASLKGLPATWLNSFYLPQQDRLVLNELVRQFPTISLLDMDAVIRQVQVMLEQSILAVEAMLLALLLAGLLVLASAIEASLDTRLREGALIRSLGGSRKQLVIMQAGEFFILGAFSGVMAVVGTEICSGWLNVQVFELSWQPAIWLWFTLPIVSALLIGLSGWLGIRRVIRQSPGVVLK
ncbi:ABC transporter permease [Endozoicomonas sp. 8E]|uniref:ABC transporter permease n=1 Tax=Endozoicomonas sp. 8E TaxID=3035692 RepID=UPI0029391A8D|nr:FtsX-like permease family protein [Endozoicomonas sp. 8E]WOG27760.1 FtsX-like permease family protein [Endozoicomonas sp. 8E]